jgi:hypothetical protein
MNRILTLGVLALGLILGSQEKASAWVNFKFGAGVNGNWQSGNNCFLWGLWRGAEVPGPEYFGCAGGCPTGCPSGYPSPYMGGGPDCYAGNGYPGAAYAGGPMQNYGPGALGAPTYANGPQQYPQSQQTPAAATGTTPLKNPATTIPNYQSGQTPYMPTSGSYPTNYQGAYPGSYQYNPYWSNSYYGGNYNYGMQPAYNGWNWNMPQYGN